MHIDGIEILNFSGQKPMIAWIKKSLPLPFVGTYEQALEADEKSAYYGRYEADVLMTERYVNTLWGIGAVLAVVVIGAVWLL